MKVRVTENCIPYGKTNKETIRKGRVGESTLEERRHEDYKLFYGDSVAGKYYTVYFDNCVVDLPAGCLECLDDEYNSLLQELKDLEKKIERTKTETKLRLCNEFILRYPDGNVEAYRNNNLVVNVDGESFLKSIKKIGCDFKITKYK